MRVAQEGLIFVRDFLFKNIVMLFIGVFESCWRLFLIGCHELMLMFMEFCSFILALIYWYINLEIKLDIVNEYYYNGQGILICNIVIK